jgi:hypothetical protein
MKVEEIKLAFENNVQLATVDSLKTSLQGVSSKAMIGQGLVQKGRAEYIAARNDLTSLIKEIFDTKVKAKDIGATATEQDLVKMQSQAEKTLKEYESVIKKLF